MGSRPPAAEGEPIDVASLHARMEWPPSHRYVSVSVEEGTFLQRLVRDRGATRTIEIGFAYGGSTAAIMSGHDPARPECRHTSIDPYQETFGNLGLSNMERLGFGDRLDFRRDRSDAVIPALRAEGLRFDVAFIDGNHRFDDILVDFCLVDQVLRVGGTVILHDTWMRSTRMVQAFIRRNRRDYAEERGGPANLAVFRKVDHDRRDWHHFAEFYTLRGMVSHWLTMRRLRKAAERT